MENVINYNKFQSKFNIKSCSKQGQFTGYASVFDIKDRESDIIKKGAFANVIAQDNTKEKIPLLWQHQPENPIGYIDSLYENNHGLFISAQLLLEINKANEAYSLIKSKTLTGLSIGYTIKKSHYDAKNKARIITDLQLWEISIVTFPAHPDAQVEQVKNYMFNDDFIILNQSIDRAIYILKH